MQSQKKLRKFISGVCLVAMVSIGMSSLIGAEEKIANRIRIWHPFTQPGRIAAIRNTADRFEQQTGIKVDIEVQTWPGTTEKWPIALAAGTLPDMLCAVTSDLMALWAVGATAPMNRVIEALGGADQFIPKLITDKDGNVLWYPYYGGARILLYRKSILAELGLNVPQTWDELYEVAKAVTNPPKRYGFIQPLNVNDWGELAILYALVYNLGGEFWDENLNPKLDTPEHIRAVKFLEKMYYAAHPVGALDYRIHDLMDLWWSGTMVLVFETTALQAAAFEHAPEIAKDTGAALLPRPAPPRGPHTNQAADRSFVIIKKSEPVIRAVEKFLIFANQPEEKIPFIHSMPFMLPTRRAVATDPRLWDDPILQEMRQNQEISLKGYEIGITGGLEHGPNPFAFVMERGIVEPMFHRIYVDKIPIEEALKEAQKKVEEAVKEQKQLLGWK